MFLPNGVNYPAWAPTGTGAAYLFSFTVLLLGDRLPAPLRTAHGPPLYFEAVAFITIVVLFGQILEQRAHACTSKTADLTGV